MERKCVSFFKKKFLPDCNPLKVCSRPIYSSEAWLSRLYHENHVKKDYRKEVQIWLYFAKFFPCFGQNFKKGNFPQILKKILFFSWMFFPRGILQGWTFLWENISDYRTCRVILQFGQRRVRVYWLYEARIGVSFAKLTMVVVMVHDTCTATRRVGTWATPRK